MANAAGVSARGAGQVWRTYELTAGRGLWIDIPGRHGVQYWDCPCLQRGARRPRTRGNQWTWAGERAAPLVRHVCCKLSLGFATLAELTRADSKSVARHRDKEAYWWNKERNVVRLSTREARASIHLPGQSFGQNKIEQRARSKSCSGSRYHIHTRPPPCSAST